MRELYDRYAGFLTAVCSRYIDSAEDVKDLMQESFLKIFSSMKGFRYRGEGSLKAWMSRIVSNVALKFLRDTKKLQTVTWEDAVLVDRSDDSQEPSGIGDIPPEEIQKMIRKLPVGYRTVFNLYVFEGLSHKEIARMLGIRENSSASQFLRARRLLAEMVKEYFAKENE